MFSLFGNKKIKAFGLDVSDVSIKVLELKQKNNILFPIAYSEIALPAKIITNHLIVNEEKLAENIVRAAALAKVDSKYVVASIPETKSFVRHLKLPKMPLSEVETSIPFELEQDIPVPIDQVYLDWQLIKEENDSLQVLVTATPKEYIDSLVDTLKTARLKPVAFELESQALARALIGPEDVNQAVLILDLASLQTSLIILDNKIVEYTSSIPIAGSAFTESIARNLGIATPEAEKLKKEVGLLSETKKGNIRQAILPILDNIVDEIKNVVKFHEEHSDNHQSISKVLLCGGGARLLGIADYISARLNLGAGKPLGRVSVGDPLVNLLGGSVKEKFPLSKDQSLNYSTAIGLALRGVNYS